MRLVCNLLLCFAFLQLFATFATLGTFAFWLFTFFMLSFTSLKSCFHCFCFVYCFLFVSLLNDVSQRRGKRLLNTKHDTLMVEVANCVFIGNACQKKCDLRQTTWVHKRLTNPNRRAEAEGNAYEIKNTTR